MVVARAKCHNKSNEFVFRLIVGFIQKSQSRLQQDLVDISLSNTFSIVKLDSINTAILCNTFTSLVCEPVTSRNQIKQDKSTPTFQLVLASVLNNNASSFDDKPSSTFQLVVASVDWKSKASNKPFRTLRLDRIKSKMPFTFQLIVGSKQLHQTKPQQFLVHVWLSNAISNHGINQHESSCTPLLAAHAMCLNSHKSSCASSKIISIAKPSDEVNLVDRIFETSDAFNRRQLIVTFIKPNANILLSNSEAEMHNTELDSRERQPNDRIIEIDPLPSLPFQEAHMITPSLSLKFIVESLSEGARFGSTTFQAFALIVTLTSIVNFQLVVGFYPIQYSEGARAPFSALIVGYRSSKHPFIFATITEYFVRE